METKQNTYVCKKTYIEQGKAVFIKNKMYIGKGNHITGECSVVYMDDTAINKYFEETKIPKLVESKDNVNHPSHYAQGGIECIDAMEAAYGTQAVIHFCMCNAFKYQWRFKNKNGKEDLLKCQWYQNKLMELQNKLN